MPERTTDLQPVMLYSGTYRDEVKKLPHFWLVHAGCVKPHERPQMHPWPKDTPLRPEWHCERCEGLFGDAARPM